VAFSIRSSHRVEVEIQNTLVPEPGPACGRLWMSNTLSHSLFTLSFWEKSEKSRDLSKGSCVFFVFLVVESTGEAGN
jgi:hypothetical protein